MGRKKAAKRLNRETWLKNALRVLSKEGNAGLRIQGLCDALGVSRGSFYWHFESRDAFKIALFDYWYANYTKKAITDVERDGGTAAEKLANIIAVVHEQYLTRYDLAFRSWATSDLKVAKLVRKTDRIRLDYLRSLFYEIGFSGSALEIRARVCLSYMALENDVFGKLDHKYRADLVEKLHSFLLQK